MWVVQLLILVLLDVASVLSSVISTTSTLKLPDSASVLQDDILLPPNYDEVLLSNHYLMDVPAKNVDRNRRADSFFTISGFWGFLKVLTEDKKAAFIESDIPKLWPGGVVNYIFKENEVDHHHKTLIRMALKDIEQHTCLRFRETTSHGFYLRVRNIGMGCASVLGYHKEVEYVDLYLSGEPCYTRGSIQHEFLHALGFGHEHTRPDRDSYVLIQWSNIATGTEINFKKRTTRGWVTDSLPYDYGSVMHYRADAFQKDNSSLTVVPRLPGAIRLVGQRNHMSKLDVDKLNLLYNCRRPALLFTLPKICSLRNTSSKMKFICDKLEMISDKYFSNNYNFTNNTIT